MTKLELKKEAIRMRVEDRKSLREIAGNLGISQSTASLWVREYPLSKIEVHNKLSVNSNMISIKNAECLKQYKEANPTKSEIPSHFTSKQKGDIAQLKVASKLTELGYLISMPYGDRAPYDLVADMNGKLLRVQVKYSRIIDGIITISLKSTSTKNGEWVTKRYTKDEIDCVIAYVSDNDSYYLVGKDLLLHSNISLRDYASNVNHPSIRWTKDYILR